MSRTNISEKHTKDNTYKTYAALQLGYNIYTCKM